MLGASIEFMFISAVFTLVSSVLKSDWLAFKEICPELSSMSLSAVLTLPSRLSSSVWDAFNNKLASFASATISTSLTLISKSVNAVNSVGSNCACAISFSTKVLVAYNPN